MFDFVRNNRTVFQSGCYILHPPQQYFRDPVAPDSQQHLGRMFIAAVLEMRCSGLSLSSVCISLVLNVDVVLSIFSCIYLQSICPFLMKWPLSILLIF